MLIAFAGLATSHPYTDARNLRARGVPGGFVLWEGDPGRAETFLAEHPLAARVAEVDELVARGPDAVVVTVTPPEVADVVGAVLDAGLPVMVNKPAAVTSAQLARLDERVRGRERLLLTGSVLRFAPAIAKLTESERRELLSVRVTVRHDIAWWADGASSWQDAADIGGGIAAVMGVHGFELLDSLLGPGFEVRWVRGSRRHLADLQGPDVVLIGVEWPDGLAAVVEVFGRSDVESYEIALHRAAGTRVVSLPTAGADPFGYHGAVDALLAMAAGRDSPVEWSRSRGVLAAVAAARAGSRDER